MFGWSRRRFAGPLFDGFDNLYVGQRARSLPSPSPSGHAGANR
ncbi:pyrrolo-quinoline quinone domain protein [Mycobacterium ulcerans str. Harvey]|uniref:Pyrrolo-quinoline quinone domain protein n=1 Tax=Mycobacterium ulcerans str. Harvey TaxID=1299332 RepID=A0ABN0QUR0_MYCUL|nr:pyrrolo-quinoline quinone domain protein [Mycobacterium ulcerans str. Harvey]